MQAIGMHSRHSFYTACSKVSNAQWTFTLRSKLSQKLAISSAVLLPATFLLQKHSNASFSALWNRLLLAKQSLTYSMYLS